MITVGPRGGRATLGLPGTGAGFNTVIEFGVSDSACFWHWRPDVDNQQVPIVDARELGDSCVMWVVQKDIFCPCAL